VLAFKLLAWNTRTKYTHIITVKSTLVILEMVPSLFSMNGSLQHSIIAKNSIMVSGMTTWKNSFFHSKMMEKAIIGSFSRFILVKY
jgi:hypothetical protein